VKLPHARPKMAENPKQSVLVRMGGEITMPVERIVSLVPSLTESIFQLGAGKKLCGRTEFCTQPEGEVEDIEALGGPKSIDGDRILELAPNVILASREENEKDQIMYLLSKIPVLLVDPASPEDAPLIWRALGALVGEPQKAETLACEVEKELQATKSKTDERGEKGPRFIYFVWKKPWMAAGHDTYISKALALAGFQNALPEEHRRFPELSDEQLHACDADAHLFGSEPWAFHLPEDLLIKNEAGVAELEKSIFRVEEGPISTLVNSESLSWYPSRAAEGLRYVRELREKMSKFC
jgi:ABC-type Fe3+-hydroxamate transport system substrate-binding protein